MYLYYIAFLYFLGLLNELRIYALGRPSGERNGRGLARFKMEGMAVSWHLLLDSNDI